MTAPGPGGPSGPVEPAVPLSVLLGTRAGGARGAAGLPGELQELAVDPARSPTVVTHRLTGDPAAWTPEPPGPDALLLVRDVLDTPVYDASTRRVRRVAEVWLTERDGGLAVLGVELGSRSVWQRLLPGSRRPPVAPHRLVRLEDVHPVSPHGHALALRSESAMVHRLEEEDLAHLLTHLPVPLAADVVRRLPEERVRGALDRLHPHVAGRLAHGVAGTTSSRRRTRRTAGWRLHLPRGSRGGGRS